MEDILASIRRDLSEDEPEEGAEAAEAEIAPEPEPEPEPGPGDVLELTPEMIASDEAVPDPAARASADALHELARVLLSQRDIPIGGRDVTLEGLVREILRPLLREWLDRNLPDVIERLANEEINRTSGRPDRADN